MMLAFWLAAGGLAVALSVVILARAAWAARRAGAAEAPEEALYRRQLAELDELAGRGLLDPGALQAARAEAARRLLRAADRRDPPERASDSASRRLILAAIGLTAVASVGLYLVLGSPGRPDAPYALRVATWRRQDPANLDPPRLAAVLRDVAAERPSDPRAWAFLARAELAAQQPFEAERAARRALRLAPDDAALYALMGQIRLAQADGKASAGSTAAFQEALRRDPGQAEARYFLGRAKIEGGDVAGGLADWRALLAALPADDPRRPVLQADVRALESGRVSGSGVDARAAQAAPAVQASGADRSAMIRGMVAGLAARLQTSPDDPAGWARLVRAYRVLGDAKAEQAALARARALFARRPDALKQIEAESR